MSRNRGRSLSTGPRTRRAQQREDDAQSLASDAGSDRSEPRLSNAGALTPRGSTAIDQLVAVTTRQTEAFVEALRLLARPADPSQAFAQLLQQQADTQAEAARLQAETARLKHAERLAEKERRHKDLLAQQEAQLVHQRALAEELEERRAAAASLAEARRQEAQIAAAMNNRPTAESLVAASTKSTNEIKRALRDCTKLGNVKDWCSHLFSYDEFCTRHNLNDHMAYLHVEDTLVGDALLTWKGFKLQWHDSESSAWIAHNGYIPVANASRMPADWVPPPQPPLFNWRLEFEKRVFLYSQFDASVARWRNYKQGTSEPPMVSLQDLWLSHEKAFQSWGRYSARITEMERVSQLLLCLSPRNRQYLLIHGAPDPEDPKCTHAEVFRWVLKCANYGPSQDEYREMQPTNIGALPVSAKQDQGPKIRRPTRGQPPPQPRAPSSTASAPRRSRSPAPRRTAESSVCLRCHDAGHWASACEAALTPAQVRDNVAKVAAARLNGECFLCHSTEHWADTCTAGPALPVEIMAIWTAAVQADDDEFDEEEDAWPGDEYPNDTSAPIAITCVMLAPPPAPDCHAIPSPSTTLVETLPHPLEKDLPSPSSPTAHAAIDSPLVVIPASVALDDHLPCDDHEDTMPFVTPPSRYTKHTKAQQRYWQSLFFNTARIGLRRTMFSKDGTRQRTFLCREPLWNDTPRPWPFSTTSQPAPNHDRPTPRRKLRRVRPPWLTALLRQRPSRKASLAGRTHLHDTPLQEHDNFLRPRGDVLFREVHLRADPRRRLSRRSRLAVQRNSLPLSLHALAVAPVSINVASIAAAPVDHASSTHLVKTFEVEGQPMDVHIDTCSPFCLVNAASLNDKQRALCRPYTGPRLLGGNAAGMNVTGQYKGKIKINNLTFKIPWLVCENLPMQRILGWDFTKRHIPHINPVENTMVCVSKCPAHLDSWALFPNSKPKRVVATVNPAAPTTPGPSWADFNSLVADIQRIDTTLATTPVCIAMPAAPTAQLTAENVARLAELGGAAPRVLLPGCAQSAPDPFFLRAATGESMPSLLVASSCSSDDYAFPPEQHRARSCASDSTGPPSLVSDRTTDEFGQPTADPVTQAHLQDKLVLKSGRCTVVTVVLPTPPAGHSNVLLADDPTSHLTLPAAATPSASLSAITFANNVYTATVCVNNVTNSTLRLKAGTGICDAVFIPDENQPSPLPDNTVLRLPWLEWLRKKFALSIDELNNFKELYQSRALATSTFGDDDWWINPVWKDLEQALQLIKTGKPKRFIILGPVRRNRLDGDSWSSALRAWGCQEIFLPRSVGTGFFQRCDANGNLVDLPLPPDGWDVAAYLGTREQIGELPEWMAVMPTCANAPEDDSERPYHQVKLDTDNLTPDEIVKCRAFIKKWAHIFDVENYPRVKDFEVKIDLTGVQPHYCPPRRLSPQRRTLQRESVQRMLKLGVIEPGSGPWASPMTQVPKPDGTMRDCHDLRIANSRIPRDGYPLPNIADIFDKLSGTKYMCASDLYKGFWQLRVHPDSRDLFGFVTQDGLYRFTVLPFGWNNAPAIFQRLMDTTMAGLLWVTVVVYLDDCIWFGNDLDTTLANGDAVLQRLSDRNMRLRADKCFWFYQELRLLGHIVNGTGVKPDPAKLTALTALAAPTDVVTLSHFLGLAGYYMRFVDDFANLAAPLFLLRKRDAAWVWGPEQVAAFESIKAALCRPGLLLRHPVDGAPLRIETDASMRSVAGCISQQIDDKWYPIAFASRCLTSAERNYAVTELECLAVVYCVNKFRCYVLGRPFDLVVDHSALKWLLLSKEAPTGKLARWILLLQEFQFTVIHRPGHLHTVADALSRLPRLHEDDPAPHDVDGSQYKPLAMLLTTTPLCNIELNNDKYATLSSAKWTRHATGLPYDSSAHRACLAAAAHCRASKAVLATTLFEDTPTPPAAALRIPNRFEVCGAQRACPEFRAFFTQLTSGDPTPAEILACPGFNRCIDNLVLDASGLLLYRARSSSRSTITPDVPVIPPDLRPTFLDLAHGSHVGGHLGASKTLHALSRIGWWPTQRADVDRFVAACDCVRRRGKLPLRNHCPLQQIRSTGNNDVVAADIAGPWPVTDGYTRVLVVTCLFSRFTMLFPMTTLSTAETAQRLLDGWILVFGPMKRLLTDRGPNFTSETLSEIGAFLGFDKVVTTAYNPAGDPAERRFRHLTNSIAAATHANVPWPRVLSSCAYAYNVSYNRMTGSVPLFTWLGRAPRALFPPHVDAGTGTRANAEARHEARTLYKTILAETEKVFRATTDANTAVKRNFDLALDKNYVPPTVGDLVWVFTPRLFRNEEDFAMFHTSKTQNRWGTHPWLVCIVHPIPYGPRTRDGELPFCQLCTHVTVANQAGTLQKVHVNRTRPYIAPFPGNGAPAERMAERITAHRDHNGRRQYQVAWWTVPTATDDAGKPIPQTTHTWLTADKISARLVASYLDEHLELNSMPVQTIGPRPRLGGACSTTTSLSTTSMSTAGSKTIRGCSPRASRDQDALRGKPE